MKALKISTSRELGLLRESYFERALAPSRELLRESSGYLERATSRELGHLRERGLPRESYFERALTFWIFKLIKLIPRVRVLPRESY